MRGGLWHAAPHLQKENSDGPSKTGRIEIFFL